MPIAWHGYKLQLEIHIRNSKLVPLLLVLIIPTFVGENATPPAVMAERLPRVVVLRARDKCCVVLPVRAHVEV